MRQPPAVRRLALRCFLVFHVAVVAVQAAGFAEGGPVQPVIGNEPPSSEHDPHECPRREAAAQDHLRDFLADGAVNQYCDGVCEGLREKTCG